MAKPNGNADLVRKFITENPNVKSKKDMSRQLLVLYPERFKDIEKARECVRGVTGARGEKYRNRTSSPELQKFFYNGFETWATENLNTDPSPWTDPYQIPTGIKQLNIIADLHSVHLDHKVLLKFLRETKDKEAVLINGDLMDSESLSRHLKSHNVIEYERELEICHQILKGLKQEFTHVYFKQGNHDFWLERYLLINAREVFRVIGLELFALLKCTELGIHTIHNLKYVTFGDLDIIHGHEFPGFGGGKFPSVSLLDKWQTFRHQYDVKVLQAHSHRVDHTISRRSKDLKFGEAWAMPAMCQKSAGYNPYAGWDNGWVVATKTDEGTKVKLVVV